MINKLSPGIFTFTTPPRVEGFASVVGKMEGEGPLGQYFDEIISDSHFGKETWEQAESRFQLESASLAIRKAGLTKEDIDIIFAGDLVNQCIASTYGLRQLEIPYIGIYGACSTMAEGLVLASLSVGGGAADRAAAVTSSHFSTAERQFRFPLSYGGQRTPTSQWTATASGSVIISKDTGGVGITGCCIGKIADMDVNDINNMGSAMAPAAAETIRRYLTATGTSPTDYDCIITGDLGLVGSKLLVEFLGKQGIDISKQHFDCGCMLYNNEEQDTHCGGSGCGCSASVLCGYFLPRLLTSRINRVLFAATGALMSPTSLQQGETIPAISHLAELRRL